MSEHPSFVPPRSSDPRLKTLHFQMLIDGKSVDADDGKEISRPSPSYDGFVASRIPEATPVEATRAVMAARRAFDDGPWPKMAGKERSRIMHRIAQAILDHVEELATIDTIEGGKAISSVRGEITNAAALWEYAAGHAEGLTGETHATLGGNHFGLMIREPIGVVGVVTPWNYPFTIASERIPWALGAGCTVVLKPSEFTSGSSIRMSELARDSGLPDGVFNVITGYGDPVGQLLAEHPATDCMSFTGSLRVGRLVGGLAAGHLKRVGLELGGKTPQVVFADADLAAAADGIAQSVFHNSGQTCVAGTRLLVDNRVRDDMVARLVELASQVRIGDPLDDDVQVGSLIHSQALDKICGYVESGLADGAVLATGGHRIGDVGNYYQPTLMTDVKPDMTIARDEIFGPVLAVFGFDTREQAIALANDTEYGLSAYVWTSNLDNAITTIRQIRAGRTGINSGGGGGGEMGIGGYRQSGLGTELGHYGFDEYSLFKNVFIDLAPKPTWFPKA